MATTEATCVIHRDRRATYSVQGIVVDDECYQRYREEYQRGLRSNNTALVSRPFLQQLIRASAEAFEESHATVQ